MGCANEKLHGQQIAYQRDFLGACWNSSLGDDEANEFLASRWMGVSRQVMGLHTTNHCFVVRALSKEEKSSAAASVANPGGGAGAAPDDPTGAQPGLRGYVSAHLPTAGTGKTAADSGALRAVMKEAIELEKVIYNGHPYLQRHELSVHSGVVFRCAPARRLYHRLSFVAEARALSRGSAPPPQQEQQQQQQQQKRRESPRTPLVVSSNEATPAGRSSNSSGGRTRSALTLHGSSGRRATQRDGDGAAAVGMPALRLGSAVARRGDWVTGDPLSEANNYPIEDRDVDGVVASQPPVVVASITAMELQALPPNAELCFGGWLYVSLQDEQERLRRSLERYDARRQRRSATATTATTAAAAALGAGASMVSSMWQSPSASLRDSPPLGPRGEGLRRHSARVDRSRRASVDGEDPFLRAAAAGRSMVAEQEQRQQRRRRSRRDNASEGDDDDEEDEEDEDLSTRSRRLTAAAASTVLEEQEAEERQTRPLDATVAAAPEADTTPVEEAVLQQQQLDVQPRSSSATSSPPTMLAVAPSLESPTGAGGAGASPSPALSTPGRKRTTSVPPPLLSTPTQHTGKYAQEAMEADALAAAWLPYAYIVVAVPMYECSIVPTSFHTALTRHKAVSLNLANTQSRQAYGVGCITAARYGGVTVVECREKINEDEDAEWVDELLRVGRAAEQRYGAAEARTNPASNSSTHAATAAASSRPGASYTARSRRPSRLMLHDARDEKLRRVKGRIWNKLHRQGLHVVLAATRTADRRQRQRSGAAADELGLTSASAGTPSRSTMFDTAAAMAPFSVEPVADGCSDCKGNPVADDKGVSRPSSSSNSSSSSSSASSRGRSSASGAPRAGRTTRSDGDGSSHGLWTRLYRSEGRRHQRGDHRQHAGGGDRGAAVPLQVRRPWVEPGHRRDDDFLLRGTFRQIGGIKYMDAESLMDGCPVSELVHGLKRWVLNLLSMPIKARPLCLYLQRYEGIASSLRLLTTQLATTAVAATVASGRVIAPANLSFNLTGGALEDAATSFASPAQAEAMMGGGGGASTGSFSAASVALANASFAAAAAMHTAPRGLQYNTYYRGPLDPVVRAVLSPEEEAMIAACQTRVLPPVLRAPEPAEAHLPVRSSGSGGDGHGGGGGRRTGGGSAGSAPAPSVLPSVSASVQSRRSARASATESSMLLHPGLQPDIDTTPHAAGEPRSVQPGAAVHADPDAPLPLPPTVEAATPQRSFAAPPPDAALVVPTTITECLLYDDPSLASVVGGGGGGSSFSAANGRALAAAAAALVLGGGIDRVSDGGVNGSFAAPLSGALSFAAPTVSGGGGADVDRLTPPPPQVDDSDGDGVTRVPGSGGADDGAEEGSACRRASPRGRQLLSDDDGDDDVVEDGAAAEESSNAERNWQLADRELRALKSELDEMHYLVATARGELLERLEEAIQLGALFLPHTRPDQVSLTLLTMKMLRQYPDEVPVKEIHTDWMPLLVALLTSSRDHLFCSCAAGGELEHRGTGAALGFLTTYNNVVAHADVCDANKRRQLHDAKTTKYTIDPLPPLPAPRPLHDIAIAPQPVRLSRAMLQEVKRVGMDATGLSFSFSGGSLGVLAGVLHYYADFLRAKYRSEVAAAGGQARDAGATVRDVLARGGFNVILRRVWVWGVSPESTRRRAPPPPPRGATALKKTRRLLQPRRRGRGDDADSTSSTESTAAAWAGEDADRVVTNTAGVVGGSVCSAGQPFRGAEAYALYDAVVYYLRVLEELHLEHHGDPSMAPTGPAKRRSVLMAWRRHKSGAGDAAAAAAAAAPAAPAAADTSGAGDASDTAVELVPRFDICVATHYYYKTMLEEARQPRGPPRGSSSLAPAPHDGAQPATAPADARKRSDMKASSTPPPAAAVSRHARAAKAAEAQQAEWERPYCGGEEAMHDSAQQRRAVKKFFKFLTDHYEQWRARTGGGGGGGGDDGGNDRITAAALSKRVHITMK